MRDSSVLFRKGMRDVAVSENTELMMEAAREAAQEPAAEHGPLTEQQFDQLAEKLIYIAMANGILRLRL